METTEYIVRDTDCKGCTRDTIFHIPKANDWEVEFTYAASKDVLVLVLKRRTEDDTGRTEKRSEGGGI